jgi:hypothetical protein
MDTGHLYKSRFIVTAVLEAPAAKTMLSQASLAPLRAILPADIDPANDPDLLYISCDGALGGVFNKNGDGITAEMAVKIHKTALHKYINLEHDRDKIIGVVLFPALTSIEEHKKLSDEEAMAAGKFYMSFAGALWKVASPMTTKYINQQGDSTDRDALSISWEIAFDTYSIGVGSRDIASARRVGMEDPSFEIYSKFLRQNGGEGKDTSGQEVFRIIEGDPIVLGYGIVSNPAANVKGILPIHEASQPEIAVEEPQKQPEPASAQEVVKTEEITISQKIEEKSINPANACVTSNTRNTMKIEKLEQLASEWMEIRKLESAATVVDFVKAIEDGSREFSKKLEERENALKTAEESKAAAEKALNDTQQIVADLRKELNEVRAAQEAAASAQKYQERMNALDSEFDLDDEDRQLIASDIKGLDDEAFAKYMSKCKKLMGGKAKKKVKATDDKDGDDKGKSGKHGEEDCEAAKAAAETKAAAEMKAAVASVVEDGSQTPVINTPAVEASLKEQIEAAFGESFKVDGKPVAKKQKK